MNAIKQRRLECGLTQRQLAAAVGKDRTTVQKWESGECRPANECFPKLAKVFNCDIELIWIPPKAVRPQKALAEEEQAIQTENQKKAIPYITARERQGLSQKQLAKKAGVDRHTVGNMENGASWPQWETRQKLRRALGMPEERLYTEEERNEIFLELERQGVIRMAMMRKRGTLIAVHVNFDDLYQELALQALRAIDRYQPDGAATLKTFVERNLEFHIEKRIVKESMHGFSGKISYPLPEIHVVSLNALMESGFDPVG